MDFMATLVGYFRAFGNRKMPPGRRARTAGERRGNEDSSRAGVNNGSLKPKKYRQNLL
jgi:hypothetical protein